MRIASFLLELLALGVHPTHASCPTSDKAQWSCKEFGRNRHAYGNVTLLFTEFIPAGSSFTGNTSVSSYNVEQTNLPTACRIVVRVETSLSSHANFEIWAPPTESWNARFLATGNGGWAGGVNYPSIVQGLRLNFATMSTDTGHNGSSADATFFLDPEAQIDFGHRALHLSTVFSKEIIEAFYQVSPSRSYYSGCSTGGRQGLVEAQLYPEDFNGVLVGAPLMPQTHLEGWEIFVGMEQYPVGEKPGYISTDLWSVIHREVLRQCDTVDGVEDGVLMDPWACDFHAEALLCGVGKNSSSCLTAAQLLNLQKVYRGWIDVNSTVVFPGPNIGAEVLGLTSYTNADVQGGYGTGFYQYGIFKDPSWDPQTLVYEDVLTAEAIEGRNDGDNPDIRTFQAKGGKLLHWHGLSDPIVPTRASPNYHQKVMSFFGDVTNYTADTSEFYRMFLIPGMGHCSGGPGAWAIGGSGQLDPPVNASSHSALLALVDWVEGKGAPTEFIGTKYTDDDVTLGVNYTRPICMYPTTAKYSGGDPLQAQSWTC